MVSCNTEARTPLSASVQMYLVAISRLRENAEPVPLSQLARELSISPVSVNEMCRKLQDQGLVVYQPYKGASLTTEGEVRANYILRRHRLWEVLLVDKLGLEYDEAHDIACQLEHATPNLLADRLDAFLNHPRTNPLGETIPHSGGVMPLQHSISLDELPAGSTGHVVQCDAPAVNRAFLSKHGVRPGATVTMLAASESDVLVQVEDRQLSLARALSVGIRVEPETA